MTPRRRGARNGRLPGLGEPHEGTSIVGLHRRSSVVIFRWLSGFIIFLSLLQPSGGSAEEAPRSVRDGGGTPGFPSQGADEAGREADDARQPEGAVEAGLPEGAVEAGHPEGAVDVARPEGAVEAGLPEGAVEAGHPEGAVEAGLPERGRAGQGGGAVGGASTATASRAGGSDSRGAERDPAPEEGRAEASYVLEAIEIRGNQRTRDAVILRELPFRPGQVLDLDDPQIELARYHLLATGFFSDVRLRLRRGSARGRVVLVVQVEERWTFVFRDLYLGVSEITPYGGVSLEELNLLGLGITLSGAFVASREQQACRFDLEAPRFLGTPMALSFGFLFNNARDFLGRAPVVVAGEEGAQPYAELSYRRLGFWLGTGVRLRPNVDLSVRYRFEMINAWPPAAAAQLDPTLGEAVGEPIEFHLRSGRSRLSALVLGLQWDTRDNLFLPTRGHRLALSATVASDLIGSSYHYFKITFLADLYQPLLPRHSLHFRLMLGSVFGDAPLYELYFVGDLSDENHSRVLGLNFSHAPPTNLFSNSIEEMQYESLAGRLDVEYIVSLYRGHHVVYGVDFFLLVGLYSLGSIEDFRSPPGGYPGGAFPFDLTLDLGIRLDTAAGLFGFSFQNLLALIPPESEE